ncbi:MAG: glycosyltransferase [Pseudomonadota bacterium]
MGQRFSTSLRTTLREKIEALGHADIVIGIPTFHSGISVVHVIESVVAGLEKYFRDSQALILVSDGGSTDDSREFAEQVEVNSYHIKKLVTIYRGIPGKGSGLRAIFEAAHFLKAKAVAVFDSDLISISPEWVKNLIDPVTSDYDLVCPYYQRYKLDGTITNSIAYNLTRALYGKRVRQPIGGDFGLSRRLVKYYLDQDVWESDVARFGIDIYMTVSAIVGGFNICQARLGAKIHGKKDPAADLGPMFQQVVGTIFQLMGGNEDLWCRIDGSTDVPLLGAEINQEADAFEIDRQTLIDYFRMGYSNFQGIWQQVLDPSDYNVIKDLVSGNGVDNFILPVETWVRTVYRYAAAFQDTPRQRIKMLSTLIPLYHARVASLVNELTHKSTEESEKLFNDQAEVFEQMKPYLCSIWKKGGTDG